MSMMTTVYHRDLKRCFLDEEIDLSATKKIKRTPNYPQQATCDWALQYRNRIKKVYQKKKEVQPKEQEYHCQVYLRLYPTTCKCAIDVIVGSSIEIIESEQLILLGKTRIAKVIKPGVVRVRLVSSLFTADDDVHEDPSLIKLQTIDRDHCHFDKQFALQLKNNQIGPGVIGKLFIESLDPSNGSYRNESPIFELNLSLVSEHQIISAFSDQYKESDSVCGCVLSSEQSRLIISDRCNMKLNDVKLVHRLAEPLRCHWKAIGRELAPCFSEVDLIDIQQTYFTLDGNHECAYQLLTEWCKRAPQQANIRFLFTRLKLPFDILVQIHNNVLRTLLSN